MLKRLMYIQDMTAALVELPFQLFPPMEDRTAWAQATDDSVLRLADEYRLQPYPMRKATDFLAFVRDGSRKADENPYFFRRRKLCVTALGCCMTGKTDDLDDVIDGLWCICEETSWVISAHNVNPIPGAPRAKDVPLPEGNAGYIDLFTAQTGMILSLVCSLLGRQLDAVTPLLRRRVQREVERRIMAPFMERDDAWWMGFIRKDLCNWTPWIVSNVLLTAALWMQDQTKMAELMVRGLGMADRWLDCVPADGGCDEGAGYWNMAGGALLDILDLVERLTAGRLTCWEDEKLRNILQFPLRVYLGSGWFVNFADCDARPILAGERLQLAGEKLGDAALMQLGTELRGDVADQLNDTPQMWRALNLLFHPKADSASLRVEEKDVWLQDLQLRVREQAGFTLCCKGGHNGESHNHNDVGSFMLYVDEKPAIVDAGNMTYTARTFSDQRYTLWNTRSMYHNVPMIGGHEQQPGKEHRACRVKPTDGGLALDMAQAYDAQAHVVRAERLASVSMGMLTLHDDIVLSEAQPVVWTFLLRDKPELHEEDAVFGGVQLCFDPGLTAAVEEVPVTDLRMVGSWPGSLWRLTLTAPTALRHDQVFLAERKRNV